MKFGGVDFFHYLCSEKKRGMRNEEGGMRLPGRRRKLSSNAMTNLQTPPTSKTPLKREN